MFIYIIHMYFNRVGLVLNSSYFCHFWLKELISCIALTLGKLLCKAMAFLLLWIPFLPASMWNFCHHLWSLCVAPCCFLVLDPYHAEHPYPPGFTPEILWGCFPIWGSQKEHTEIQSFKNNSSQHVRFPDF